MTELFNLPMPVSESVLSFLMIQPKSPKTEYVCIVIQGLSLRSSYDGIINLCYLSVTELFNLPITELFYLLLTKQSHLPLLNWSFIF
jgi:hypothetical protein